MDKIEIKKTLDHINLTRFSTLATLGAILWISIIGVWHLNYQGREHAIFLEAVVCSRAHLLLVMYSQEK